MTARSAVLAIPLLTSVAPAGCKRSPPPLVKAAGVVTLEGSPLPRCTIMLFPTFKGFGSDLIAVATSDEEGRFALECGVGPGACAGTYKATVNEAPVPPEMMRSNAADSAAKISQFYAKLPNRPIPGRLGDLASTPLQIEIVQGQESYELKLER